MFILQMLFFQIVIFAGLFWILRSLMAKHATTTTAHLQGLSADYMKKQEEVKKRLEEAERHYEELLSKAKTEAEQMRVKALQEAETAREQTVRQAREEADRIGQRAQAAQEALKDELKRSFDSKVVDRACELIQKALSDQVRREIHAHWCEELIKNGLLRLDSVSVSKEVDEVRIRSAFPLTEDQRSTLMKRLEAKAHRSLSLKEEIDPNLVAGMVIELGSLVLDGALASKIKKEARHAQDANDR